MKWNISFFNCLVDGSTAGSGNLEILVNGGHVTSYVRELGDQCFLASFVPHQATVHTIEVHLKKPIKPLLFMR